MNFLEQAPALLQTFWYIAIFTTVLFTVLMAMTFAGGGADDADFDTDTDGDTDHSGGDFKTFTFRNLINFLLGFSWTGIALFNFVPSSLLLVLISIASGAWFVWFFYMMMRTIIKLGRDQTILPEDYIGNTGQVYLTVPGNRVGQGKVLISIGGSTREFDAVTDGGLIENGRAVRVSEVIGGSTLLVESVI